MTSRAKAAAAAPAAAPAAAAKPAEASSDADASAASAPAASVSAAAAAPKSSAAAATAARLAEFSGDEQAGGAAEEKFEGPLEDRLVHTNWKAREQAYKELKALLAGDAKEGRLAV
jgi:hypothetical protein